MSVRGAVRKGIASWDQLINGDHEFILGSSGKGSGNYINGSTLRIVFHAPVQQASRAVPSSGLPSNAVSLTAMGASSHTIEAKKGKRRLMVDLSGN